MRPRFHFQALRVLVAAALGICPLIARGDCSLTTTGNVPLDDLGPGTYKGYTGGLYPNGSNTRPAAHNAAGLDIASQVQPLDALGNPDTAHGKIVMISVGMSNATEEFASKGDGAFKPRADADLSKNPQLTIVDGAQSGKDATKWLDPLAPDVGGGRFAPSGSGRNSSAGAGRVAQGSAYRPGQLRRFPDACSDATGRSRDDHP